MTLANLATQDFNGASAPPGWSVDSGVAVATAPAGSASGGNALHCTAFYSGVNAYYQTRDGNAGDASASVSMYFGPATNHFESVSLYVRSTTPDASQTCYRVNIDMGDAGPGLSLQKSVSGASTDLVASFAPASFAHSAWYRVTLSAVGTAPSCALSVQVQRLSDSKWLQGDGSWGASQPSGGCVSYTDSSAISGPGYAGVGFYQQDQNGDAGLYADDFSFDSVGAAPAAPTYYAVAAGGRQYVVQT